MILRRTNSEHDLFFSIKILEFIDFNFLVIIHSFFLFLNTIRLIELGALIMQRRTNYFKICRTYQQLLHFTCIICYVKKTLFCFKKTVFTLKNIQPRSESNRNSSNRKKSNQTIIQLKNQMNEKFEKLEKSFVQFEDQVKSMFTSKSYCGYINQHEQQSSNHQFFLFMPVNRQLTEERNRK